MIEDKIREVMEKQVEEILFLVREHGDERARIECELGDWKTADQLYFSIEAKLREILEEKQEPPWQSIDSAPKEDLILAFERRWCFAEWSVIHGGWFEEDAPVGGRLNPSHWMPIPPDPCN